MFYDPKKVEKWCKANSREMDLYGSLTRESLVEIARTIQKQNHSGGSIQVIRKCLVLMCIDNKDILKKIGFKRKIKTFGELEKDK